MWRVEIRGPGVLAIGVLDDDQADEAIELAEAAGWSWSVTLASTSGRRDVLQLVTHP